jgi:hypothetical protein
MTEPWAIKLKAAYEAGYYRTETAVEDQTRFPWQGKTCKDCPFWLNRVCRVYATQRDGDAHTCSYFDATHHPEERRLIDARMHAVRRIWWGHLGR